MNHLNGVLFRGLILLILISALLPSASAERIEYCDFIPEDFAGWNSSVSLPKFDPDMGTLTAVDMSCKMNLSEQIMLENINSLPGNFSMSFSGALTAELPSSEEISIPINHIIEGYLSGYDNASDYAGVSGLNSTEIVPTDTVNISISNIENFLAGAPGENITIPVKVEIKSVTTLPGNSQGGYISRAGAEICVFYTYDSMIAEDGGTE